MRGSGCARCCLIQAAPKHSFKGQAYAHMHSARISEESCMSKALRCGNNTLSLVCAGPSGDHACFIWHSRCRMPQLYHEACHYKDCRSDQDGKRQCTQHARCTAGARVVQLAGLCWRLRCWSHRYVEAEAACPGMICFVFTHSAKGVKGIHLQRQAHQCQADVMSSWANKTRSALRGAPSCHSGRWER